MREVELGSVCHFENGDRGKNYPSQSAFVESGIPFINAGNLTDYIIDEEDLNYITEERYVLLGSGKLQPMDILFCLRGSLGKFAVNEKAVRGAIASSLVLLRTKEELDTDYLKNYLKSDRIKRLIFKSDNGSSQPNLSASNVKKFPIPLPPLETQKKIASILDAADAYRQKTKDLIEKYDELTQSLFLEMFGDPYVNQYNHPYVKLETLVNSKSDLVDGPFGSSVNTKVDYIEDGEIPVIRTKNVGIDNSFIDDDLKFMNRAKYETVIRSQVLPGDVILTKVGTIGNVCIFPEIYPEAVLSTTGSCRIRINEEIINKRYFVEYLNFYKSKMLEIASAGVQAFLNMKHIKGFDILLPPFNLQNQFADRVQELEAQKAQAQQSLAKAEELFNSLLQRAFKGELAA